jgi:hypothetical protein
LGGNPFEHDLITWNHPSSLKNQKDDAVSVRMPSPNGRAEFRDGSLLGKALEGRWVNSKGDRPRPVSSGCTRSPRWAQRGQLAPAEYEIVGQPGFGASAVS